MPMSRSLHLLAGVAGLACALCAAPAWGQPVVFFEQYSSIAHTISWEDTSGGYVPRVQGLPSCSLSSSASNPNTGSGYLPSTSNASSSIGDPIVGADFASFPIGATSLSDAGEEAPFQDYVGNGGVAGFYSPANLYISFNGDIYLPDATSPGTLYFGTPSVAGNVGADVGDYDELTAVLSLGDSAERLGNSGIQLRLQYLANTPGQVFGPTDLYASAGLPAFPAGDTITVSGVISISILNFGDDATLTTGAFNETSAVPEPASLSLSLLGGGGLFLLARRRGAKTRWQ